MILTQMKGELTAIKHAGVKALLMKLLRGTIDSAAVLCQEVDKLRYQFFISTNTIFDIKANEDYQRSEL